MMMVLRDKAIAAARHLPPDQQDAIATLILEKLADEQQWDRLPRRKILDRGFPP
ncbi:MAG: hypothetical protein JXB07_17005 [Anaerolineae bacterium]|nr:hypothetical protein [Anaerolineae bacterium]